MRKFERIKGSNANIPQRATGYSAGYDIATYEETTIMPFSVAYIPTGLKVQIPKDEFFMIVPRSSLFKKHHLIIPNSMGIIDSDYYNNQDNEGHFMIVVLNLSTEPVTIPKNTKIAQGIFVKYFTVDNDNPVCGVRTGGFGSTDR